jgi:hypothetical protein
MYKISLAGKTMVGCNHDAWFDTPRIWFETEGYGACFTGARPDGKNRFAPQSGMNAFGLAFSRLVAATPSPKPIENNRLPIHDQTQYLKDILHKCKTVEEAKTFIDRYDHSSISEDVFIYIDQSGKQLIVEPYLTYIDTNANYVLANFCPSEIADFSKIRQERYQKGKAFLKNKVSTSIDFCRSLSDTMHVCRERLGDGTLITSIWDLKDGILHLYFYHDYAHEVQFVLSEELAKGDHILEIPKLFPENKEFLQLIDFKTPLNSKLINIMLAILMTFFAASAFYFLVSFFWKRKTSAYSIIKLVLVFLSASLSYYMFVLATNINIFYFSAPYVHYKFNAISVSSYLPYLLALLIVPALILNWKIFKNAAWGFLPKWMFALQNLTYLFLIFLFAYWGFYDVFG